MAPQGRGGSVLLSCVLTDVFSMSGPIGRCTLGLSHTPKKGKMNGVGGAGDINITSLSGQNESKENKSIRILWPSRETP